MARGILFVKWDTVDGTLDEEFTAWYDQHVKDVLSVAGFTRATRFRAVDNGRIRDTSGGISWSYVTIYDVEAPDITEAHRLLWAHARNGDFPPLHRSLQTSPPPVEQMFELMVEDHEGDKWPPPR